MENFFLNNKNIENFIKPIKKFELNQTDSNFWNFFIAWKGLAEYEKLCLFKKTRLTEKQLKLDFQDKLSKMKRVSSAIANLSDDITTLDTIVVLASLEKVNILFTDKHSYYLCKNNENADYHIFGETDGKITGKIERQTVSKVLKTVSSYKLKELQDIYKLFGDPTKKTKQILYDEITKYINQE